MSTFDLIPFGTFALGWLSAALFFRELTLRLRCQRNLAEYRADEARRELALTVRERDTAAAAALSLQEGETFQPVPSYVDRVEAERLNGRLRGIDGGRR